MRAQAAEMGKGNGVAGAAPVPLHTQVRAPLVQVYSHVREIRNRDHPWGRHHV